MYVGWVGYCVVYLYIGIQGREEVPYPERGNGERSVEAY